MGAQRSRPLATTSDGRVFRAIRFPTTVRALRALRKTRWIRLPLSFVVVVQPGRLRLVGWRRPRVFLDLPAESVLAVAVEETRSTSPYPSVDLAITLRVQSDDGIVDLPVIPVSDDGKRSLTWNDREVHALARRLSEALGLPATT